MKKIVNFFRTSPLTRGQIVVVLIGVILLSGFFIIGGIYQFATDPSSFSNISFIAVGIILIGFGMIGINPKAVHDWWVTEAPTDRDF
jgi:hypothetical protein